MQAAKVRKRAAVSTARRRTRKCEGTIASQVKGYRVCCAANLSQLDIGPRVQGSVQLAANHTRTWSETLSAPMMMLGSRVPANASTRGEGEVP